MSRSSWLTSTPSSLCSCSVSEQSSLFGCVMDRVGGKLLTTLVTDLLEDGDPGRWKAGRKERKRLKLCFVCFPEPHLILCDISQCSQLPWCWLGRWDRPWLPALTHHGEPPLFPGPRDCLYWQMLCTTQYYLELERNTCKRKGFFELIGFLRTRRFCTTERKIKPANCLFTLYEIVNCAITRIW